MSIFGVILVRIFPYSDWIRTRITQNTDTFYSVINTKDFIRNDSNEDEKLHKKWSFPLRISPINVTKSTVSCGFGHIYWRNPQWKTSFFVHCHTSLGLFSGITFLIKARTSVLFFSLCMVLWVCLTVPLMMILLSVNKKWSCLLLSNLNVHILVVQPKISV